MGRTFGTASPSRRSPSAGAIWPPGLSMTRRVTPWRMNMVASVTTIGCMRRTATKKPLKAPEAIPIPIPAATRARGESEGFWRVEASTTLTSEIAAPAERSKPPDKMTMVCPIAASASGAAARRKLRHVIVGEPDRADGRNDRRAARGRRRAAIRSRRSRARRLNGEGAAAGSRGWVVCARHRHAALRGPASAPSAARRIASSDSSSAGISETIRPA